MNIKERIESYWDKRSDAFNELRLQELKSPNAKAWHALLAQHIPLERPIRILDVGTGTGFFTFLLCHHGHTVTGIDMSQQMVNHARQNAATFHSTATFEKMDATKLSYENDTFDAVLSRNLTWTLPDPKAAYTEWLRVLKPKGVILNFDSDYGKTTFARNEGHVHANVDSQILDECTAIKNSLTISQETRPAWDLKTCKQLGAHEVSLVPDVHPYVQQDMSLQYEEIPIFMMRVVK